MAVPIRTCCACGAKRCKAEMERFVFSVDGPVLDVTQVRPGRGAYCCSSEECRTRFLGWKKKWKRWFRL